MGERAGQAQAADVGSTTDASQTSAAKNEDVATDAAISACPSTFEREPALLPFLIENAIGVGGAVRRPDAYPVAGPVTAEVALNIAEGSSRSHEGRSEEHKAE